MIGSGGVAAFGVAAVAAAMVVAATSVTRGCVSAVEILMLASRALGAGRGSGTLWASAPAIDTTEASTAITTMELQRKPAFNGRRSECRLTA
jgi:hypothetical protein